MITTRMHTQDAEHQLSGLGAAARTLRLILADRLTETQHRRMMLLFGLDGAEAMSLRKAGRAEGVTQQAVAQARDAALLRLRDDWRLWAFWLTLDDSYMGEEVLHLRETNGGTRTRMTKGPDGARTQRHQNAILDPADDGVWGIEYGEWEGFSAHQPYPGTDGWESDAFTPTSREDAYGDGWIAQNEGVPESENPYRGQAREAWAEGWRAAATP